MDTLSVKPPPEPLPKVQARHLERADTAWRARVAGATWKQAAQMAGYATPESAIKGVQSAFGELPPLQAADLRNLWRDRLEVLWRQTLTDIAEQRPGAVTAGVRVAQAAALLDGLNAPV